MVCLGAVGFAFTVIVVSEFYSACWAVCDAYGLCSCEYLFSELFVFSGACPAHRVFSSSLLFLLLVLGGGASQRQRDERLHRLTLLLFPFSYLLLPCLSFVVVFGVVRAQLCEHARYPRTPLCCGFVYLVVCVLFRRSTVSVAPTHCSLLTIIALTIEH